MNYLLLLQQNIANQSTRITDDETLTHLKKVLKVQLNDNIKVAVVHGLLGTAQVTEINSTSILLTNINTTQSPPPKLPVTLVLALPRPKALRRIIMDATSMGIAEIYLIHSYRVEKSYWQSPHLKKLTEYSQLGLAQAGDSILPKIHLKKRFKPFVEDELPDIIHDKQAIVAHPHSNFTLSNIFNKNSHDTKDHELVLIIGAEGGFIPYEIDLLKKQGCTPASIYSRILRTETAISMIIGKYVQAFSSQ